MNQNKGFKASVAGLFSAALVLGALPGCTKSSSGSTLTGTAEGRNGDVTVELVYEDGVIKSVTVTEQQETAEIAGDALESIPAAMVAANTPNVDTVSGATITSEAIINAARNALESGGIDPDSLGAAAAHENVPVTYTAGTYTGTAEGYNGPVELSVTFTEDSIESIEVTTTSETAHVGDVAYDIMFADAMEANGSGVDSVSGATFTSKAVKDALVDAAEKANASDLAGFKTNTVVHEAGEAIEETYDIVIIGSGGAGMGAAAQAVQNGNTVLVIEENAEIGGNTLVSGGQFQSVMPYLVWDAENPDATEAKWDYDGNTYTKLKATQGQLTVLKTILNWSEEEFDGNYFEDNNVEYVAGEIDALSQAGVHSEYLPTLQALKKEIQAYVDYADAKMKAGAAESDLTLFSTVNLHIFQTYYGGLRQSADGSTWIYGDFDLVSQFIEDGQGLKEWLEDQGSLFADGRQLTLIGALWYRENQNMGGDIDKDGVVDATGNWGTYFLPLKTTVESAEGNRIMTRTTAENLIVENGKVVGVTATQYDGTPVTAYASEGVIIATGGYAANIDMVVEENEYWDSSYVTTGIKTTNRSSLQGDGIVMAQDVGADTTGLGFSQMMPISWIDNGNLAFGGGQYAVYINPTTGERFVDESAERDVLSLGEFANGISYEGTNGVFLEITNADTAIGIPYPYDKYENGQVSEISTENVEDRVYFVSTAEEMQAVLDQYGMKASPEDIYATIRQYDEAFLNDTVPSDGIKKSAATTTIGTVTDSGEYKLEGEMLRIRIMAPSTHHTMGGLTVDTERHVLDTDGNIIEGLYAAGEVTGGIHGGNRLGGNAIVEILVSGRTAANTIAAGK